MKSRWKTPLLRSSTTVTSSKFPRTFGCAPNARSIACSRSAERAAFPVKRIPVWLIVVVALAILVAGKVAIDETKPAAGTRAAGGAGGAGGGGGATQVHIAVLQ